MYGSGQRSDDVFTQKEWAVINNLINKSNSPNCAFVVEMEPRYYYSCVIVSVLSFSVPSDEKKDEIVNAFHQLAEQSTDEQMAVWIPENYKELESYVFQNCLLTRMIKKAPICLRCNRVVSSQCFFCPVCLEEGGVFPIYRTCKTKTCYQEQMIRDILQKCTKRTPKALAEARKTVCHHSAKIPWTSCAYYVPVLAVVLELLRSRCFDDLPCTSMSELLGVVEERTMGNMHALSSLNSAALFERWGCGVLSGALHVLGKQEMTVDVSSFCDYLQRVIDENTKLLRSMYSAPSSSLIPTVPTIKKRGGIQSLSMMSEKAKKTLSCQSLWSLYVDAFVSPANKSKKGNKGSYDADHSVDYHPKRVNTTQSPFPNESERQPLLPQECDGIQNALPLPDIPLPCDVRLPVIC